LIVEGGSAAGISILSSGMSNIYFGSSLGGNANAWIRSQDTGEFLIATALSTMVFRAGSLGSFVFNEDGYDVDFRVESNNETHMLFVDAGNDFVGIGTANPGQKLEVDGGIRLNTAATKPTCDSTVRGTLWFTQGGAGVADALEVCAKDAANAYAWRTLY
ncbi:unnamed protein product, partial [marine sediment metagenome]